MRVQEATDQFLDDLQTEGRSPHTIAAYRRDLMAFCRFAGDIPLDTVTPAMLTRFMATDGVQTGPRGTLRAKATINRYRVALKALFAWAAARWLIPRNPTVILKCRRHRSLPPEVLTAGEIERLLSFPFTGRWAERDRALLAFMLGTGCRLGETVALNGRDIDWDSGRVTLKSPKGGEPEVVYAGEWVLRMLRTHCPTVPSPLPVFRTGTGRRLSHRQVQRIVAARCQEAGIIKHITPHTLRHTFATMVYNATGDIRLVQQALRHEFITTTQMYAQVDPARLEAAFRTARKPPQTP